MNRIQKALKNFNDGLKTIVMQMNEIIKSIDEVIDDDDEKTLSDKETVIKIINKSGNEIDVKAIQEKTGFNAKKISNILNRAFKKGLIQKIARGSYKTRECLYENTRKS